MHGVILAFYSGVLSRVPYRWMFPFCTFPSSLRPNRPVSPIPYSLRSHQCNHELWRDEATGIFFQCFLVLLTIYLAILGRKNDSDSAYRDMMNMVSENSDLSHFHLRLSTRRHHARTRKACTAFVVQGPLMGTCISQIGMAVAVANRWKSVSSEPPTRSTPWLHCTTPFLLQNLDRPS
jgi:hypothetical protein